MQTPVSDIEINTGLLKSPAIQKMSDEEYRRKFLAAVLGEVNEFSPFMRRIGSSERVDGLD